jgi:hypothetical protein
MGGGRARVSARPKAEFVPPSDHQESFEIHYRNSHRRYRRRAGCLPGRRRDVAVRGADGSQHHRGLCFRQQWRGIRERGPDAPAIATVQIPGGLAGPVDRGGPGATRRRPGGGQKSSGPKGGRSPGPASGSAAFRSVVRPAASRPAPRATIGFTPAHSDGDARQLWLVLRPVRLP